ncbi:MAG: hypothetical protein ACK5PQ_04195 [Alphaproteobacteria bacterium]
MPFVSEFFIALFTILALIFAMSHAHDILGFCGVVRKNHGGNKGIGTGKKKDNSSRLSSKRKTKRTFAS